MDFEEQRRISRNLKYLRTLNRYTQNELAEILNISPTIYYRYESLSLMPPIDFFYNLSRLYRIPIDVIFETDKSKFTYYVSLFRTSSKQLTRLLKAYDSLTVMSQGRLLEYAAILLEYEKDQNAKGLLAHPLIPEKKPYCKRRT